MAAQRQTFDEMKSFVELDDGDVARLVALGPVFAKHGPAITDAFYDRLASFPEAAAFLEGRIAALKGTHARWMGSLFTGVYEQAWFDEQLRIGMAHVRIGLDPKWVEGVMSFLRTSSMAAIRTELGTSEAALAHHASLIKILDLDLLVINQAYAEERLDRLTAFTGMSRRLIERCVMQGGA